MSPTRVQILAREPVQKYSQTTARTVEWCAGMEQVNKGGYSNLHVFQPPASSARVRDSAFVCVQA